ncbi:MAG: hypothetical protein WDW38_004033 [Sanguina aurantia]
MAAFRTRQHSRTGSRANVLRKQRDVLRRVIYKQQVSMMMAACTEYQRTVAFKPPHWQQSGTLAWLK